MMELELKRQRRGDGKTLKVYTLGSYEVSDITYDSVWHDTRIRTDKRKLYLPEIYARYDEEGHILGFDIQTTSYGAMPPESIREVVGGLEEALEAVEILTREFVKSAAMSC